MAPSPRPFGVRRRTLLGALGRIGGPLDHVDSEIEEIAEWQREYERVHDELRGE